MGKPKWFEVAERERGIKEWPGNWQDNPRILEYFKATTYHATHDEVPWCAAFLNWCLAQAGIKGSRSAAAVSFLNWGRELEHAKDGCIVVFEWPNGGHHVALYDLAHDEVDDPDHIACLGGNQSDKVNTAVFPVSAVMAYRWPVN